MSGVLFVFAGVKRGANGTKRQNQDRKLRLETVSCLRHGECVRLEGGSVCDREGEGQRQSDQRRYTLKRDRNYTRPICVFLISPVLHFILWSSRYEHY